MTDTTTNSPAADKRTKVADHFLLNANGEVVKDMAQATGIRYVAVDRPNAPFEFQFDGATPGTALTMLALFGAKTKATNEASRVRNGEGGGTDEQLSAIEDVFEQLRGGVWREKSEGGAGSRIDRDTVAECLVQMASAAGKDIGTRDTVAQRFVDGHTGADGKPLTGEQYFKLVWSSDAIKAAYRKAKGQTGPALDTLF